MINALGTVRVVRLGATAATAGMLAAALGLGHVLPVTVVGLVVYGLGIGVWDVAMNVEGAEVERGLGRTIMPRFHAGFSGGTVVGALVGALLVELSVPAAAHLGAVVLLAFALVWRTSPAFLPVVETHEEQRISAARAWLEPRTLLIGVMVLALAMTEGTANDWLAVALVDGHDVSHAVGVAGFAVFVLAMTAGRFAGTEPHRPLRPGGRAVGDHGAGRRRRPADRLRRRARAGRRRHRAVGRRRLARASPWA